MEYRDKRREEPRADATVKVRYNSVKDFLIEYSRDISKKGIFLATPDPLPEESDIRILLYLPDGSKEIEILGRVIHTITEERGKEAGQEPGMGIEFTDFPANGRREMDEYVEGLLAKKDIEIDKRRQHPRFDTKIKVGFKNVNDFLWAYSEDISKGGIFIKTTDPMPMNSKVQLKLCLPDRSKEISVVGKVINIFKGGETERGPGMGLQLIDFDKGAKKEIEEYMEELIKRDDSKEKDQ
ncbi:MAG: TIGR02266 family protein [Deltaproteobacteria bacterium]|nr:MAG: TIGR02266 family protein [Deltaproteobacteria bacterium]